MITKKGWGITWMSLDCHCHNLPSTVMQSNQANQLVYFSNEISSFFPFFWPPLYGALLIWVDVERGKCSVAEICYWMRKIMQQQLCLEVFPTASEFRLSSCGSQQLLKSTPLFSFFFVENACLQSAVSFWPSCTHCMHVMRHCWNYCMYGEDF